MVFRKPPKSAWKLPLLWGVADRHQAGVPVFLPAMIVRENEMSASELAGILSVILSARRAAGTIIFLNLGSDRDEALRKLDLALEFGCHGVQLPERSLTVADVRRRSDRTIRIGRSVHPAAGSVETEGETPDFFLAAPVFETVGKPNAAPIGLGPLAKFCEASPVPVIGLGGITPERAWSVLDAGASAIAVRQGIFRASDPANAVRSYLLALGV